MAPDIRHKIVGGLLTPKDETGDCFKFATALAAKAEDLGARFVYSTNIEGLDIESGQVRGVVTGSD